MTPAELEAYREQHPEAAARVDARRARVAGLLAAFAPYEHRDLDATDIERLQLIELLDEKYVETDDIEWRITPRGHDALRRHAERTERAGERP
jgi:hypothetical protein